MSPDTILQDSTLSALSPVQAKVVLALAQGETITKAALSAGVHRSTVHEWLRKDPGFAAALRRSRAESIETLRDQMKELSALALDTLRSLLDNPGTPPAVRLRGALAILERPRYPDRGWNLPESINTAKDDEFLRDFALLKKDYEVVQMEQTIRKHVQQEETGHAPEPGPAPAAVARNAPCPCGSGLKYKRCCGAAGAAGYRLAGACA